jgi:CheY-like chemotaxis protein
MGGRIWVEPAPPRGSEFLFTMELEQSDARTIPIDRARSRATLRGRTVGIVDDNESAAELLREYCQQEGMVVEFLANSGHEAIESLEDLAKAGRTPEVLVTDIAMPGMDGYGLLKTLRADARFRDMKLIAATCDLTTRHERGADIDGYVAKPLVRSDLANVIVRTLISETAEVELPSREEPRRPQMRVLVAEDNSVNMKLVRRLLERIGSVTLEEAVNGREAVEKMESGTYDLVLMDVQMPEMNGIEATEVIRSRISKEIPIVALTAAVLPEDRERALQAGMNDFLTKPIDVNKLREVIETYAA